MIHFRTRLAALIGLFFMFTVSAQIFTYALPPKPKKGHAVKINKKLPRKNRHNRGSDASGKHSTDKFGKERPSIHEISVPKITDVNSFPPNTVVNSQNNLNMQVDLGRKVLQQIKLQPQEKAAALPVSAELVDKLNSGQELYSAFNPNWESLLSEKLSPVYTAALREALESTDELFRNEVFAEQFWYAETLDSNLENELRERGVPENKMLDTMFKIEATLTELGIPHAEITWLIDVRQFVKTHDTFPSAYFDWPQHTDLKYVREFMETDHPIAVKLKEMENQIHAEKDKIFFSPENEQKLIQELNRFVANNGRLPSLIFNPYIEDYIVGDEEGELCDKINRFVNHNPSCELGKMRERLKQEIDGN